MPIQALSKTKHEAKKTTPHMFSIWDTEINKDLSIQRSKTITEKRAKSRHHLRPAVGDDVNDQLYLEVPTSVTSYLSKHPVDSAMN